MRANEVIAANLRDLELELAWFTRLLDLRLRNYFPSGDAAASGKRTASRAPKPASLPPPPDHADSQSTWATFLRKRQLSLAERAALVLVLVPHLRPRLLDVFFTKNATFDRRFTEFGGSREGDQLEPTGETLAFLLGGDSLEARVTVARLLESGRRLVGADVLRVAATGREQGLLKAPLRISPEYLRLFTVGRRARPDLGADFPARRIETALGWDDLILHPGTRKQIGEIAAFIAHGRTLMHDWKMASRLRPGHRALFYGAPGTGKTLTAALLGKLPRRDVYRVDLSLVVSKYIGETEKNLARLFDRAQQEIWILFFDEAEARFGKRTETKDAHDRYANQEVAYLLQRLEIFDGVAVLATNMRDNLDQAFTRRFETVIFFPMPRPAERLELWKRGISPRAVLAADVDLPALAERHELSGGSIMNVIRHVSLMAIAEGQRTITGEDLHTAIRRELAKEGKRA